MWDMFNREHANFSGILEEYQPLFVSTAIHKAVIEIKEKGSEAAAASGNFIGFILLHFQRLSKRV